MIGLTSRFKMNTKHLHWFSKSIKFLCLTLIMINHLNLILNLQNQTKILFSMPQIIFMYLSDCFMRFMRESSG